MNGYPRDLVGYGADPDRVVSAVRRLPEPVYTVRGNHDRVVTDLDLAAGFNEAAQRAEARRLEREVRLTHPARSAPLFRYRPGGDGVEFLG